MYLYHVTPRNNWYSIGVQGLLLHMSNRRREKIGLVTFHNLSWAVNHCCLKYHCSQDDLIVVKVRVRRHTLRRNKIPGVWYSTEDIYPCRIETVYGKPREIGGIDFTAKWKG
jgi:hypothetical protein